jgi:putative endopeptidase
MRTSRSWMLLLAACSGQRPTTLETPMPDPDVVPVVAKTEVTAEQEVMDALDTAADPCVDFYAFACGSWVEQTPLPADKAIVVRSFTGIDDRNEVLIKEVLEQAAAAPGADAGSQELDTQKLGAFWRSCMDEATIDAKGVQPLQPWLARIDALKDKKALMGLVGELYAQGYGALLQLWVDSDPKNPGLAILHLLQAGTGLPERDYYLEPQHAEMRSLYEQHVTKMFELAGIPEPQLRARDVLAFETKLAQAQWKPAEMRDADKTYNKLDRKGLEKLTPGLNWGAWLTGVGQPSLTQINVMTPSYFEGMAKAVASTELPVLQSYLKWRVLSGAADELARPIEQESFRFYGQVLYGQKEQQPRWKRCVAQTNAALGDLLAQAYVAKAFSGESKPLAADMITRIEKAFEEGLPKLSWMDPETQSRAVEKARAITNKVGYPDQFRTYPFEVAPDDFFGNLRESAAHEHGWWLAKAEKPVDPSLWFMTAHTVNAYYNASQNEIVFPAGILQPPFFSKDFPAALNFGAMGMVVGHEITHGFDDQGRKYDGEGRLTDWWGPDAVGRFEKAAECVQTQYAGYEIEPGLNVNGELTLGENIADLGGTRVAYRAYRQWVAEHGEEPQFAGMSGDQLFFVSFAQAWCAVTSPENARVDAATDTHSPPRFRVNGPLANLPEFAAAFQCEPGEPMRPENQCEIW